MLIYFIIMSIGIILLIVTVILGEVMDVVDLGLEFGDGGTSPLSGPVIGIGLTAFGATGMLTQTYDWPSFLSALTSGVSALSFGALGWWMLAIIHRQTGSTDQSMTSMRGRMGEVTTGISSNGIGEVLLTSSDSTRSVLARSKDGLPIAPGTVVRVVETYGGSVVVEPAFAPPANQPGESPSHSAEV